MAYDLTSLRGSQSTTRGSCTRKVAEDFAYPWPSARGYIDNDLAYNRVASEIWRDRVGHGQEIAQVRATVTAQLCVRTFPRIPFATAASPISFRFSLTGERQSNRLSNAFANPSRRCPVFSLFDASC